MPAEVMRTETGPEALARFLGLMEDSVTADAFVSLELDDYQGPEPELCRMSVRPIRLKGSAHLCFVDHHRTRDVTRNLPLAAGVEAVRPLPGRLFRKARLRSLTADARLEVRGDGGMHLVCAPAARDALPSTGHDREKQRLLDPRRPWLHALGITDATGRVLPSMSAKWKQIDKFLEVFGHALASSPAAGRAELNVTDFGCGKGYLTFAVHDFLRHRRGIEARVTGLELRPELARFCEETARRLSCDGLAFRPGDIRDEATGPLDAMIALHACDTATDLALHRGIRAGAAILLCSPCCHQELRPQLKPPEVLRPVLRFGIQLAQEAEMVTDSLRALLLEASGYRASVFEFVSPEHTDKNKMILAVRRKDPVRPEPILARIAALKGFYGIGEQTLESLLTRDGMLQE